MVREDLELILNQTSKDIDADLRREAALASRLESEPAYNQDYPPIREAISSVDVTSFCQDADITAQLRRRNVASAEYVEGKSDRPVQSLISLEFRVELDPLDSLASLRKVNYN